jgi:UDP-GlcNAc:undecaprenyl-phosphate GlcNAc-1-phosphate transferase
MIWLIVAIVAVACGWIGTRLARALAVRINLVDKPDGRRKMQVKPIPLAGGIGVFLGTTAALLIVGLAIPEIQAEFLANRSFLVSLFVAGSIIAVTGVLDDRFNLRARYKLAGQMLAAFVMILGGGLMIRSVSLVELRIDLGLLEIPFTLFWFLAAINALNLLDGMDGLLGTIGVIVFTTLATMAMAFGSPVAGWVAIAMAGALIGFLRYNLPPASVYLGDCGSMLIGLVVASIAVQSSLKGPAVAIVAPAVLLILPILDTTAAIIRRKLTGRGLAVPDRGHLHHVLMRNGFSNRRVLLLVTVLGGAAAGGAFVSMYMKNDLIAIGTAFAIVLILMLAGLFGNAEYRLVRERTLSIFKKVTGGRSHIETEVRLHGSIDWAIIWRDVTSAAEQLNVQTICLDVNCPAWHEDYHVRWDRVGPTPPPYTMWRAEIPLSGHGQVIGRLTCLGPKDQGLSFAEKLIVLSQIIESAEAKAADAVASSGRMPQPTIDPTPVAT